MARSPSIAGGSAGGSAAAALPDWELVDVTDGSWTSADPGSNARVDSVAVSSNETTVTWTGFTGGPGDALDGSTFDGLRYYRALTYPDGTAVDLADDGWTIETWVDTPAVAGCARAQFALGISSDPTASANATTNFSGLYWSPDRTDGVPYVGQIRTTASPLTAFNSLNRYGYGRTAFVGGTSGQSFAWAIKSDGTSTGYNNRSMTAYSGTVYLQLSIGVPDTRVISASSTNVFAVFYRVLRTPIGPSGDAP